MKEKVYEKLDELGIKYKIINHPAVFTVEEANKIDIKEDGIIFKNLFLKDKKNKKYYLFSLSKDKKCNLKEIEMQLNSSKLSFASVEELKQYLNLNKGEVTPLGIIKDNDKIVEVVFDKELIHCDKIGIHPNDNTATIFLSFSDLIKVIEDNGNKIHYINV